jgi:ParB family chromosome partitioning protein
MALDLSALEIDLDAPSPAAASGKPLELALTDILEDPKNARRVYDPVKMAELTASIAEKGVKSPISVKRHPTIPGKYLTNHGHRRCRGSKEAGKTHIPAFIDELHDDYDQVVENLQREDLTPLELAMFISSKLDEGERKSQIAQKLGKKPAMITEHLALIDPPGPILDLYRQGLLISPRTIYDLRQLYEKYPDQVQAFLEAHEGDIERRTVERWADAIKNPPKSSPEGLGFRHDENQGGSSEGAQPPTSGALPQAPGGATEALSVGSPPAQTTPAAADGENGQGAGNEEGRGVTHLVSHNATNEKALNAKTAPAPDPTRIKKPVMLVECEGRAAMVLLWNRPTMPGLLKIKYEDNSEEEEVDAGRCKINCLLEATT